MLKTLKTQLSSVKQKIEEINNKTIKQREEINNQITALNKHTKKYTDGWAGDWAEDQNLYFADFNPSVNSAIYFNIDKLKKDLLKSSKVDLNPMCEHIRPIGKMFLELQDFIISELSIIKELEIYKNEAELFKQIEDFEWGVKPGEYANKVRPQQIFIQDFNSINKGIETPPHILLTDEILTNYTKNSSFETFIKLANRLIRQLEVKITTSFETEKVLIFQQQALSTIFNKFHLVANQMKNRYDNRDTLIINDEYDVQDLMGCLLRINFEDVRKEEYTPSYAGSSTRVDFLLKRENILIEVKKTRNTLKDKEVGNQLIQDIAHYKSHPNCKHLICFVYDPENLISNPRGLEDDLSKNTTEDMIIEVFIRP